jgi:hypothetical protein
MLMLADCYRGNCFPRGQGRRVAHSGATVASAVASLATGLVIVFSIGAHIVTVLLRLLTHNDFDQILPLTLGIAVVIPGLQCVWMAAALTRGELHAQKRTLAAAVVILGMMAPLSAVEPLAATASALASFSIATLLASPTRLAVSEQEVSSHC